MGEMRYRLGCILILAVLIGIAVEAHAQRASGTMKMWMAYPERDQLLLVAGAMAATSVFTACENKQQSVGVVLEALKAGYQTGVFTADDKFGERFFEASSPTIALSLPISSRSEKRRYGSERQHASFTFHPDTVGRTGGEGSSNDQADAVGREAACQGDPR